MKEFWNERYGEMAYAYGEEPNAWFAECLRALLPGRMLLPAEGEGRNAVHAAQQGWQVCAFDISEAGRNKAMALAEKHGVSIEYRIGTLDEVVPFPHEFDALALVFAHFPASIRVGLSQQLLDNLRPGGHFIFEAFGKDQLNYQSKYRSGGPQQLDMLYSVEEVRAEFTGVDLIHLEEVEVELREGPYHSGLAKVVRAFGTKR